PPTSDLVTQASQAVPQGSRSPAAIADSNVQIHIENHFSEAVLSVWVDQELAYEQPLRDGHKRHLVLFGRGAKETVTIPLSSGTHGLRVRVRSAAEQYEQSRTISGEFLEGGSKILSINFEKHNKEMRLTLQ
ncbi:MAG TPA: hypothetical protein VGV15_02315, partial [Terriglobales bacterium]|nr:hypothetical protein [Terriglobales bacterium]